MYRAAGTPLVACASAGPAAHVVDGVDGLLTPIDDVAALRDALARVLSDEVLRQNLITNGFETYSQSFTPEAVTAQWIAFYKSVEQNAGLTALKDGNKFAA